MSDMHHEIILPDFGPVFRYDRYRDYIIGLNPETRNIMLGRVWKTADGDYFNEIKQEESPWYFFKSENGNGYTSLATTNSLAALIPNAFLNIPRKPEFAGRTLAVLACANIKVTFSTTAMARRIGTVQFWHRLSNGVTILKDAPIGKWGQTGIQTYAASAYVIEAASCAWNYTLPSDITSLNSLYIELVHAGLSSDDWVRSNILNWSIQAAFID